MKKPLKIAIDGPAASGKSTTARILAGRLHYIYIDTGAMYRAATLAVLSAEGDAADEAASCSIIRKADIQIALENHEQYTYLDGHDVTDKIRTPDIDKAISAISSYPAVRKIMVSKQRQLARPGGVVMDGRDIGTVVLPDADLKVFMVASIETRAKRRRLELQEKGIDRPLEEVIDDIRRRDRFDSTREQSPLRKADDARELDTTGLTIEQQVQKIYRWALELLKSRHASFS